MRLSISLYVCVFFCQPDKECLQCVTFREFIATCEIFSTNNYALLHPEVHKLLTLYLIIPVAGIDAESSFYTE